MDDVDLMIAWPIAKNRNSWKLVGLLFCLVSITETSHIITQPHSSMIARGGRFCAEESFQQFMATKPNEL
jgi:hypothetical protein